MRKFIKLFIVMAMAVSLVSAPCFAVPITRGDKVFGGKVTFLKDVVAKKDFSVHGAFKGDDYSNVFYVDGTGGADVPHYGKTWELPFDTIAYALDQCTANNGDIIYVMPGHTKTITADSGIDIDVAGVSIICLGSGSDRPTFTFTTATTADFKMAAANTRLYNALFVTNYDGHDMAIEIGADDVEIGWCEFREGTHQPEFGIQVGASGSDNDADRAWIHDCKFYVPTAGDGDAAISVLKDMVGVKIERCVIYGDFDLAGIDVPTGADAQVDMLISDCVVTNLLSANHAIQVSSDTSTGKIVNCMLESDAIGTSIDAGGLEVYTVLWSDGTDQASADEALSPCAAANTFSTAELAAIEGEATDAIEADSLDKMFAIDGGTHAYPDSPANESVIAYILSKSATAAVTSYDNQTDSLEALRDQMDDGTDILGGIELDHFMKTAVATAAYPASVTAESVLAYILAIDADPTDYDEGTDSLEAIGHQVTDVNQEARVVAANVTDLLDHLVKTTDGGTHAYPDSPAAESIVSYILSKAATAVTTSYDNTTDSLEMLSDKAGGFSGDGGAAQDDSAKASLDLAHTDIDVLLAAMGPSYSHANYLLVDTGTFDTSGTWSTAATHELLTVTGCVRMTIIPECSTNVTSVSNTGTIQLGDETTTDSIIAASTLGASAMVAGELWVDATLTRTILTQTQVNAITFYVCNGKDIGYEVATNALSGGVIKWHVFWTPVDSTGAVVAGAGGTL